MQHADQLALEAKIFELCNAVKAVSSVVADQLAHPKGRLVTSDYGLEVRTFEIDASMVRYAVDHAAELALELKRRVGSS